MDALVDDPGQEVTIGVLQDDPARRVPPGVDDEHLRVAIDAPQLPAPLATLHQEMTRRQSTGEVAATDPQPECFLGLVDGHDPRVDDLVDAQPHTARQCEHTLEVAEVDAHLVVGDMDVDGHGPRAYDGVQRSAPVADGRFAPSPTGDLHLGSLRTALVAWLFARSAGSRFRLRIEDLDPVATRPGMAERHLDDLQALGLDWDGPVRYQSAHRDEHDAAVEQLVAAGLTYPCWCTRREIREAASAPHGPFPEGAYPGTCRDLSARQRAERAASGRPPALRLRADARRVTFTDRLHGSITMAVDDFVVRRNDGLVAYNVAVVVDDTAQRIGEVVRGDDLLDSTPRQVLLAQLLDLPVPTYAHVPLVLGHDGVRLAKRHGAITLGELRAKGRAPAEVLAALARSLGLASPDEDPSVITPTRLLGRFAPERLPRDPWVLTAGGDVLTTP